MWKHGEWYDDDEEVMKMVGEDEVNQTEWWHELVGEVPENVINDIIDFVEADVAYSKLRYTDPDNEGLRATYYDLQRKANKNITDILGEDWRFEDGYYLTPLGEKLENTIRNMKVNMERRYKR